MHGDLKDSKEENHIGFDLSIPHGQEDQTVDKYLDIMHIVVTYEDGCDTAFYSSRLMISYQCFLTLRRRNYIVNAKIPNSKNTFYYLQI